MLDALVSVLLKQLTTILYEEARQEVKLVTGVGEEINTLKSNLESIHALLDDAEERQFNQKSIQLWLDRLKDVCYDMEDVLDEWNTALLKLRLVDGGVQIGKVCCPFIPCLSFGQVVHRRDIALKIKEINRRLDEIAKEKDRYGLVPRDVTRQPRRSEETTSFTEVSKLQGRDEVKKDLVTRLLCDNNESGEIRNHIVKAISVVGMGGIGKTALAQLVHNDSEVGSNFDRRIWICVSEVFDVSKIAREISVALQAPPLDGLEPLQRLLEICCKFIAGKKVFLVLDDVWTEDSKKWEPIKQIFKQAAAGSRVLVTTRKDAVVQGCLMRSKKTREQWEQILNSELWKLDSVQEDVFVPLLLSYYDLPSAIRRCFLYCSIFPKDFVLERDCLIRLWMAHGYISSSEYAEMEVTGREYFDCLHDRNLLQVPDQYHSVSGNIFRSFSGQMHDLVHDFTFFLTKGEIVIKEASEDSVVELPPESTRHLSIIKAAASAQKTTFPASSSGAKKLRSLAIFGSSSFSRESNLDFHTLLDGSKLLRSLELYYNDHGATYSNYFHEEFSKDIGKLVHLRLFSLSLEPTITRLPEEVCELFNLQTLNLISCKAIKELPDGIGILINLRILDTSGCNALSYYPKGIGKLTSLWELKGVRATGEKIDDEKFSVGDLENLCHLRDLHLSVVGCRINANEARRAKLQDKAHLRRLSLGFYAHVNRNKATQLLNPPSHAKLVQFTETSKLRTLFHTVLIETCGWIRTSRFDRMTRTNIPYIKRPKQRLLGSSCKHHVNGEISPDGKFTHSNGPTLYLD